MSEKHYLPGLSNKTKTINQILKEIYNFETKPLNDDSKNLNQLAQELQRIGTSFVQINSYNYTNIYIEEIRAKVEVYSNEFDLHLESLVHNKESELEEILNSIDSTKNNLAILTPLRQKADSIEDYINSDNGIIGTLDLRGISFSGIFSEYSENREQIDNIDKELSLINERYNNFFNSNNEVKELKSLLKATRTKRLFKTEIYKKCKDSRYYEGIIALENIHQNIKLLLSNKTEYNVFVSYQKNLAKKKTKTQEKQISKTHNAKIVQGTTFQTTPQLESQSFSHLHALIRSVGYPEDYSYFILVDTLNGKYSSNWSERLSQFSLELDKIELTSSGREYLSQINKCLEIAQGQGQYLDEIYFARNSIEEKLAA